MGYIISICGKGGTGKTLVAGLIVRYLISHGQGPILAIDADPNSNLGETLGLEPGASIVSILDEFSKQGTNLPGGMTRPGYLEYKIQESIVEADGFDLLVMGRPEGPGCYCYVNELLRSTMDRLTRDYPYVVVDNEAGMEHLSRRTTRSADALFIISDYSVVGLRSAKRILELVRELEIEIADSYLVINRVTGDLERLRGEIQSLGIGLVGTIPEDDGLAELSIHGKALSFLPEDSPVVRAVWKICERSIDSGQAGGQDGVRAGKGTVD